MKYFLSIILLFTTIKNFGQDFDNLMIKKQFDCSDISNSSALLFEKFFTEGKYDSAKLLIKYWESKCGLREPVHRAKLLLALKENSFNDSLLTEDALAYIFNYQSRMNMIRNNNYFSYDYYKPYYGYIPIDQDFDNFTKRTFTDLMQKYKSGQIEFLLCEFYGNDSDTIFSKLQSENYSNTFLAKSYNKAIEDYLSLPLWHYSWITGMWIPTGKLKKLGTHPDMGFQLGVKYLKMNYDFIMTFKFLNSPNSYHARRTKSSNFELTNHFFGGHIGVDIGRDIFVDPAYEFQLTGGIAFDGFDALNEDKDKNLKSATTWTYNFNFGINYRYYLSNSFYLGLRAKYNIVDYSLNKLIDFTGNPITIHFSIGGISNAFRRDNLNALKYYSR